MSQSTSAAVPDFVSRQVADPRRYFLNLKPARTARLTVVGGGCERCLADYVVERASFPFHCIEFVAEGAGEVVLNGRTFPLPAGSAFYYGPGVRHRIRTDPARPMLKYYVNFWGTEARRLLAAGPWSRHEVVVVTEPAEVLELFAALQRNGQRDGRHRDAVCAALITALLLKLAEGGAVPAGADPRAQATFQRVKRCLEERHLELKTLEEAAALTHVNVAYACRLFQRFHPCSPYQYLMRLKMQRAAERLLEGRLVKEVAAELSFSDPYNFSRAFKSVYGLSPEKFIGLGRRPRRLAGKAGTLPAE